MMEWYWQGETEVPECQISSKTFQRFSWDMRTGIDERMYGGHEHQWMDYIFLCGLRCANKAQ
jgi:hypothetical protein